MDFAAQLAAFEADAELAYERCLQEFVDDRALIITEARRRLEMGFGIYGDRSWNLPAGKLAFERRQEYADAVNYRVMEMHAGPEQADPFIEYALSGGPDD